MCMYQYAKYSTKNVVKHDVYHKFTSLNIVNYAFVRTKNILYVYAVDTCFNLSVFKVTPIC